jgi:hypothetical protein
MSIKIYFLKTHKINLTNLLVGQLLKNAGESCYGPCEYFLDGKFIESTLGDFAKFQIQSISKDFRNIKWNEHLPSLNTSISLAKNENKVLIFGNYDSDQLLFLKSQRGSDIKTISIDYTETCYDLLLENLAEYHLYLLKKQTLLPNEQDLELISTLSDQQLIQHYKSKFDLNNYIPHSSITNADYNVFVEDFFNPQLMSNHFDNIGLPFNDESRVFYDSWLSVI